MGAVFQRSKEVRHQWLIRRVAPSTTLVYTIPAVRVNARKIKSLGHPALVVRCRHDPVPSPRTLRIDDALRGDCAFRHLECCRDGALGKQSFVTAQRDRHILSQKASTKSCFMSVCTRFALPQTCKSGPSFCLSFVIFSAISPFRNTAGCHS
jgi:hypothetical protein